MTATYAPAEVFPPGEYLRDELGERDWTVTEFAEIIGRPVQVVSEILNGKKEITTETAIAFADALGTTAALWLNLQTNYRLATQRAEAQLSGAVSPVARRARLRDLLPVAEARRRGWIPDTDDLDVLDRHVLALLEIQSFDERPRFALAARRANSKEPITLEQIAWLAHVRAIAGERDLPPLDLGRLAQVAAELPRTLLDGPGRLADVPGLLRSSGVALVFSEGLRGGKLDGAVTMLPDGTPVVGLTARGDRFDGLVFTLLHECAHLVLGHIQAHDVSIVDDDAAEGPTDSTERAANEQAATWLFPRGLELDSTTVPAIVAAAAANEVHPSLVLGRVQRDRGNWKLHRSLVPKVRAILADQGLLA